MGLFGDWIGAKFYISGCSAAIETVPDYHKVEQIVTVNGMKTETMPVFNLTTESCDGEAREVIEITETKPSNFTTIRRPDMNTVKCQYAHTQDK